MTGGKDDIGRTRSSFSVDARAATPAVGKTLEIGIGVLVVALLTSTLYGSVVPGYRTAAGDELADRSLSRAIAATERAVPPPSDAATATVELQLPATIRGATYEIHAVGRALELQHPHPGIGRSVPLAIPEHVVSVTGTWRSTEPFHATAQSSGGKITISIGGTDE